MTTQTADIKNDAETLGNVISTNVRVALALRDKNQSDLSRALGVSRTLISQKMRGVTSWTIADMAGAGAYLDIAPSKFLEPNGLLAGGIGPRYLVSPDNPGVSFYIRRAATRGCTVCYTPRSSSARDSPDCVLVA